MKRPLFFLLFLLVSITVCHCQKKMDEPLTYKDELDFGWSNIDDTLQLKAKSKILAPIRFAFYSKEDGSELNSFLLRPKDSLVLLKYYGNRTDSVYLKKIKDSIRIGYTWGHEQLIEPNLDYRYRLPFKKGKKYEVSQGFNGKTSHNSIRSKYAIDFQLDVGEPVYAAREGTVVQVVDWFTKQGGTELINSANRIVILHDDGTMAFYVHLDYEGSFVEEGQKVNKGDKIGISGVTGYTRGPHLHFVVRKENNTAIPIYFEGYEGKVLKKGKKYKVKS